MLYVTDMHALNVPMPDTDGDWHASCLDWSNVRVAESDGSLFGDDGIVVARVRGEERPCANHARACLDMMADGSFGSLSGMRRDILNNESYTSWVMACARRLMSAHPELSEGVDRLMRKEYRMDWVRFLREMEGGGSHGCER